MSLLITPTLLDSYSWFLKCPPSWKKKAFQDLSNKLNRVPWDPTPAIRRGMDFEKTVYRFCNKNPDSYNATELFKKICGYFKGGRFQEKVKKFVQFDNKEFLLYGKMDAVFPNIIRDLKTTKDYKGQNKYLGGWQHKIYTVGTGITEFEYVIAEWDPNVTDPEKLVPGELFIVRYELEDMDEVMNEIIEFIRDFIQFIENDGELADAYYHKFNRF